MATACAAALVIAYNLEDACRLGRLPLVSGTALDSSCSGGVGPIKCFTGYKAISNDCKEHILLFLSTLEETHAMRADLADVSPPNIEDIFSLRKPKDIKAGISSGLKSIGKGIVGGAVGLVAAPIVGATSEGLPGFAKGVAAGVAGAVLLPATGVTVGLVQLARGVANQPEALIENIKGKAWDKETRVWVEQPEVAIITYDTAAAAQRHYLAGLAGIHPEADYYALLAVSKDASQQQIKRQYYTLARQHHPDKNAGDPEAHERFQQLGQAYQILSNPVLRKRYDQSGAAAVSGVEFMDNSAFFSALFGSEMFDHLVGELVIATVARSCECEGETEDIRPSELKRLQTERVHRLAVFLKALLRRFVEGDEEGFRFSMRLEAHRLSSASFGVTLLHCIGAVYGRQADIYLGGFLGGTLARVKQGRDTLRSHLNVANAALKVINHQEQMQAFDRQCEERQQLKQLHQQQRQAQQQQQEQQQQQHEEEVAGEESRQYEGRMWSLQQQLQQHNLQQAHQDHHQQQHLRPNQQQQTKQRQDEQTQEEADSMWTLQLQMQQRRKKRANSQAQEVQEACTPPITAGNGCTTTTASGGSAGDQVIAIAAQHRSSSSSSSSVSNGMELPGAGCTGEALHVWDAVWFGRRSGSIASTVDVVDSQQQEEEQQDGSSPSQQQQQGEVAGVLQHCSTANTVDVAGSVQQAQQRQVHVHQNTYQWQQQQAQRCQDLLGPGQQCGACSRDLGLHDSSCSIQQQQQEQQWWPQRGDDQAQCCAGSSASGNSCHTAESSSSDMTASVEGFPEVQLHQQQQPVSLSISVACYEDSAISEDSLTAAERASKESDGSGMRAAGPGLVPGQDRTKHDGTTEAAVAGLRNSGSSFEPVGGPLPPVAATADVQSLQPRCQVGDSSVDSSAAAGGVGDHSANTDAAAEDGSSLDSGSSASETLDELEPPAAATLDELLQRAQLEDTGMDLLLEAMWAANAVDIQATLGKVCQSVLWDRKASSTVRCLRAAALKEVAAMFCSVDRLPSSTVRGAKQHMQAAYEAVLAKQAAEQDVASQAF